MKNTFRTLISIALATVIFIGCKQKSTEIVSDDTITIENMGRVVTFSKTLNNVVVFDEGAMDNMSELGIPFKGMAKLYSPKYLSKYANDTSIVNVGASTQPNFEAVSKINPDLIIMSNWFESDYPEFSKIAPTISLGNSGSNYLTSTKKNLDMMGSIFQVEDKTKVLKEKIDAKVAEIQKVINQSDKKALLLMYDSKTYREFGTGSRYNFIFHELGVKPAAPDLESGSDYGNAVSSEFILEHNPDILYIIDKSAAIEGIITSKQEMENALIQKTNAYKNGKVVYLDPDVWYLGGAGYISLNVMLDEIYNSYK